MSGHGIAEFSAALSLVVHSLVPVAGRCRSLAAQRASRFLLLLPFLSGFARPASCISHISARELLSLAGLADRLQPRLSPGLTNPSTRVISLSGQRRPELLDLTSRGLLAGWRSFTYPRLYCLTASDPVNESLWELMAGVTFDP